MESRASKLFIKRCIWLNKQAKVAQFFFSSAYITLLITTGYKVLYGTYLAAHYTYRFVLMLVCFSVQKFCHGLARSTYKPDFLFSNFGFGVLHSQKSYIMFRCIECYVPKTELGIRFQQLTLIRSLYFLILTIYLSYLDQVLPPIAVMPFIYQNKAQKTF